MTRQASPLSGQSPLGATRVPGKGLSTRRSVNPQSGRGANANTFATTLARASRLSSPAPRSSSLVSRVAPTGHESVSGVAGGAPWPSGGEVPYASLIQDAARRAGIEPALVAAVAHAESNFNARATSPAGAKGLMQLMNGTARGLGVADPFDPEQNLAGGARLLAGLLKQFRGDPALALAAYNAGPGAVQRFGGIPPYEETRRYVPKVLGLLDHYRRLWAPAPAEEIA